MQARTIFGLVTLITCAIITILVSVKLLYVPTPPPTSAPTSAPTAAPTPEPTTAPTMRRGWVGGRPFLYPRGPLFEQQFSHPRRCEFRAGAVVPGVEGMKIDEASDLLIATYPNVSLRVVDQADSLNLEVRRDRITIIADLFTKRVVSARVG